MAEEPAGWLKRGLRFGSKSNSAMHTSKSAVEGEVIWITGASSGMGQALALRMAEAGATVIASARSEEALDALATVHGNITPLVFDVTDNTALDEIRQQLREIRPWLDRVIINAGNCEYFDIAQPDWSMMQRIMSVNYFGAVNTLAVAMPLLENRPGGNGHIIGVASLATLAPFARAEAYGASKAALQYFFDALRVDLRKYKIDVTVINPGFVKTPLTDKNDFPMPFLINVDEATQRMMTAILQRRRQYDFPLRLKWLLKALMLVPGLWYSVVGPVLNR